ncbi:uncharacterized protein LOC135925662 isoform X3 [Gordionus sp. m RMFG-2023]|uniref:uncharacterized protein LOC135925662 isoform X3 n=1 Tax=Gordionus sp. m RMFG-2023 TaxID=3053472 RepID=UPI0031FDF3D0
MKMYSKILFVHICFLAVFYSSFGSEPWDDDDNSSADTKPPTDIDRYKKLVEVKQWPIDVVAVIESTSEKIRDYECSLSISYGSYYQLQKNNPIGPKGAGFGVVTYDTWAKVHLKLNSATSFLEVSRYPEPIISHKKCLDLEKALKLAKKELTKNGRDKSIKQIWVYISEKSAGNPEEIAQTIKKWGIEIFVFAIGSNINSKQIDAIATDHDHIFWYPDYCTSSQSLIELVNNKFLSPF